MLFSSVAQVAVKAISNGQAVVNVFHYRFNNYTALNPAAFPVSASNVGVSFRSAWRANILPLLGSSYTVLNYQVNELTDRIANPSPAGGSTDYLPVLGEGWEIDGVPGTDSGTVATDELPLLNSVNVKKNTGIPRRWTQGSFHLAPIPEAATVTNALTPVAEAAFNVATDLMIPFTYGAGATDNSMTMCVLSRNRWLNIGITGLTTFPSDPAWCNLVIDTNAEALLGTILRRKPRVG